MVPSNTLVRDLEAEPPPYGGRGPRPQVPFVRMDRWAAAQPSSAWTTIEIRPGEKGPLIVEAMKRRVSAKTDRRRAGPEEVLVVFREKQAVVATGRMQGEVFVAEEVLAKHDETYMPKEVADKMGVAHQKHDVQVPPAGNTP